MQVDVLPVDVTYSTVDFDVEVENPSTLVGTLVAVSSLILLGDYIDSFASHGCR